MFKEFNEMLGNGDSLTIVITKTGEKLATSIVPRKSGLKDSAKEMILPLVLTGTPEELDADFIKEISMPIRKATGLLTNLREFEKSTEVAEANSKAAKVEAEKAKKATDEKKKKYDIAIKQADEKEKEGKLREAIVALKEADKYATSNHGAISGRISKLKAKLGANSIFGAFEEEEETDLPLEKAAENLYQEESIEENIEDIEEANKEEE